MGKFLTWLGGATTARFGVMGILVALILFAIPSAFYFLIEGGVVMHPSVSIILGIIMIIIAFGALVALCFLFWIWVRDGLIDTTPQRLSNIEQKLTSIERSIDNLAKTKKKGEGESG